MATTADVWTDLEQEIVDKAINQWRKTTPVRAFIKTKGEHFEHLL